MNTKRVFLIVLDSFGVGELPDAANYGDEGSDTFGAVSRSEYFNMPNMRKLGLFNIDGVSPEGAVEHPLASYGKAAERSAGKDTTTGHWEIAGLVSEKPMPTFSNGFPQSVIDEFSSLTGRGVLCNKPYSGTKVIMDYGRQHMETGDLIVYTSADSVFQVAAHEEIVPLEQLYDYCRTARKILTGDFAVGRVIARPFNGKYPDFYRTSGRHDFSLEPTGETMLDRMKAAGFDVISVGKINDIFASCGITDHRGINKNNADGMEKALKLQHEDFNGLCFVNLVDFDMVYGHRNDIDGYAKALTEFDIYLGKFLENMRPDDVLMITADHGCDPSTPSTDHSREYIPLLIYGEGIKHGINLGVLGTFSDISAFVLDLFGLPALKSGKSFKAEVSVGEA
ncbi:MAG: phosphopentomutase [Acutalibacteraceae bacterium]